MLEQGLLFIIAFLSNTLSALAGGGAGLIQLPALIFLGLSFHIALCTHKIASVFLGIGASYAHFKSQQLNWQLTLILLGFGLPGVVLGAAWVVHLPEQAALILLGLLTIALGVYSIFKPQLGLQALNKHRCLRGYLIGGIVLLLLGLLNGSLTSGTGLFVTLWTIYWFGLSYKVAIAYSLILVGIFWNATGAFTLWLNSEPQLDWLPALIIGSLIGGYTGAKLSQSKNNLFIKRIFESVTIITGISLLIKAATLLQSF